LAEGALSITKDGADDVAGVGAGVGVARAVTVAAVASDGARGLADGPTSEDPHAAAAITTRAAIARNTTSMFPAS